MVRVVLTNAWFNVVTHTFYQSFLQGWDPTFFEDPLPPFWVPYPLSEANLESYPPLPPLPSFWEPSKLIDANCKKHFKTKVLRFALYKSTENIINIILFTFRLNSVFTTDTFFG